MSEHILMAYLVDILDRMQESPELLPYVNQLNGKLPCGRRLEELPGALPLWRVHGLRKAPHDCRIYMCLVKTAAMEPYYLTAITRKLRGRRIILDLRIGVRELNNSLGLI